MTAVTSSTPVTRSPKTATLAVTGILLAAVVIFAGNYNVRKGENGGTSEGLATAVLCAIVAAIVFLVVLPRVRNHGRAALILGVLSVLSLVAFWSGVTPILTAATMTAGAADASPGRRTSVVRMLSVAATVLTVGWTLANSHLF